MCNEFSKQEVQMLLYRKYIKKTLIHVYVVDNNSMLMFCYEYSWTVINKYNKTQTKGIISLSSLFQGFVVSNYLCNKCLSPLNCEFISRSWRRILDTTLGDKSFSVTCARSVVFSEYSSFLLPNKSDRHDTGLSIENGSGRFSPFISRKTAGYFVEREKWNFISIMSIFTMFW
jgi:hypothetical protein